MTLTPASPPENRETNLPEDRTGILNYVRSSALEVAKQTAEALGDSATSSLPLDQLVEEYHSLAEKWASKESFWNGSFCDFLEYVASARDEDSTASDQEKLIDSLSVEITRQVPFQATCCPIAHQADSGRNLYTKYPQVADVCGFLKCPVIEAGNTDFLVLTSINPYTTKLTADVVGEILYRDTNVVPFVFSTTCPVKTRDHLCARHFVYES